MSDKKIAKRAGQLTSNETAKQIAQALCDLETTVVDLKKELKPLQITDAKEYELGEGKKAIVIFVPVPLLKQFHNIQPKLTRELEKKFSDSHVMFIADRRILPKPGHRSRVKQLRPRSRTLTSVHEKYLEDLVYPIEIIGKRTRVKTDGSKVIKVRLDSKDQSLEHKIDTFKAVYKNLTSKDVQFEFYAYPLE
ncbi:3261_t:CDS:2 [Entrophospora sp. SA101]|nr:9365_t:CDS:2 [Entrophospora sp. SA101]CAJ0753835.1 3261_t:CDS:2 [Entrophospora sp. SA101]CAJ0841148.1 3924_t:CDS:2 [Entrophospora sp. SA101]CAJ0921982.1 17895_t:CDS:2 [Entrophospora sp. SA101]